MIKVLVTGGSGFIGSNLVNYLLDKNYFVINVDKLAYSSNNYKKPKTSKYYKFVKLDINKRDKLIKIIKKYKPKAIFNLAAETHVDRSIDGPQNFIEANIIGTFNVLETIRYFKNKFEIKLIHISTDEVYGDIKNNLKSDEQFPYNPSSPYSASKAAADHLIRSYIRTYKINAVISNCCNNYGPFQFPEKLIPKMISNIFNNKKLPVYSKGQNIREWIHVKDHCEALYLIFLKGKSGQSYNVGTNESLKNIDLIRKILKICKKKKINIGKNSKVQFVKDRPGHDFRYSLNSSKIKKKLNWKKKVNIDDGLSSTIEWYYKNKKFLKQILKKDYEKRFGLKI